MTTSEEIADLLGRKLWTTQLFLPDYRPGRIGDWRIDPGGQLVNDWGYFSGPQLVEMLPSLARRRRGKTTAEQESWDTWMSLTPTEIESQEFACRYAMGNVVIMGLGMGWVACNIALKDDVTSVTVVEIDPDVIELFDVSGAGNSLPQTARDKITIVEASALEWQPAEGLELDFLFADIWLHFEEPGTLDQVRTMHSNTNARTVYYWGQELTIHRLLQKEDPGLLMAAEDRFRDALHRLTRLPLLVPDGVRYPELVEQAVRNRIERGIASPD